MIFLGPGVAQSGHRLLADVAAADEPFVVGFDGEHRDEPDQAGVVGEDADDVGAPADLAVEALERVGASAAWASARPGTRRRRGRRLRRPRAARRPSAAAARAARRRRAAARGPASPSSAVKIGRMSAPSASCWSLRAWPRSRGGSGRCSAARRAEDLRERRLQARVRVGDGQLRRRPGRARPGRAGTRARTPRSRPRRRRGR